MDRCKWPTTPPRPSDDACSLSMDATDAEAVVSVLPFLQDRGFTADDGLRPAAHASEDMRSRGQPRLELVRVSSSPRLRGETASARGDTPQGAQNGQGGICVTAATLGQCTHTLTRLIVRLEPKEVLE